MVRSRMSAFAVTGRIFIRPDSHLPTIQMSPRMLNKASVFSLEFTGTFWGSQISVTSQGLKQPPQGNSMLDLVLYVISAGS